MSSQLADPPSSMVEGQHLGKGREQAEHTAQRGAGRQPSSRELHRLHSSRDYLKIM